jgi:hypothetical protein
MPEPFDIRVATSVEPPVDPQVSDIYFNAVSISAEPTVAGSDEAFEVANNPATGGSPQQSITSFTIVRFVDNGTAKVYVANGSVNNVFATGTGEDNSYTLSSSTIEFYVSCTLDSSTQEVTACEIVTSQPTNSLTLAGYGIGTASEDFITQSDKGSLSLISCGVNHYFS